MLLTMVVQFQLYLEQKKEIYPEVKLTFLSQQVNKLWYGLQEVAKTQFTATEEFC